MCRAGVGRTDTWSSAEHRESLQHGHYRDIREATRPFRLICRTVGGARMASPRLRNLVVWDEMVNDMPEAAGVDNDSKGLIIMPLLGRPGLHGNLRHPAMILE